MSSVDDHVPSVRAFRGSNNVGVVQHLYLNMLFVLTWVCKVFSKYTMLKANDKNDDFGYSCLVGHPWCFFCLMIEGFQLHS